MVGGAKPTMDGLRAAVWANTTDIRATDKDRVTVDVVWSQESILTILVIMLVFSTGVALGLACVYTHIDVHARTVCCR